MIRRLVGMVAIMLSSVICAGTHAQSNSDYTTVAIEYVGKSDRPIFPIIISISSKEAEWYRHKLFRDSVSIFTHIYIVQKATLKEISAIPLPKGDLNQPMSNNRPKTAPTIRLVMAIGHDSKEATIDAADSVVILGEIKKCVSKHPLLVGQLSEIEARMNRYLKKPYS